MSFSFYGGPKGQDFNVSRIFNNRSNDLLKDLKMRWYSPVNVGDYVFISYGDINAKDQYHTDSNGEIIKELSNYNKNLNIDLNGCGKSYNNSLWQKIYIDEDKNISPNFPDKMNDEIDQVFIFLNIDDTREVVEYFTNNSAILNLRYPLNKDLEIEAYSDNGFIQKKLVVNDDYNVNGNVITLNNNNNLSLNYKVIYKTSEEGIEIGTSLRETTQLYTKDTFGFGYRLIACLTGATPQIEFRNEPKNIEEGDPSIRIDTSVLEKPIITFQLPRAQEINKVKTNTVSSINEPNVYMDTIGEGTRTNPVLTFNLPKAAEYFTGILFGKEDGPFGAANTVADDGSIYIALNNLNIDKVHHAIKIMYYKTIIYPPTDYSYPEGYYFERGLDKYITDLKEENFNINKLPIGYYGIEENTTFNYVKNQLKSFLNGLIETNVTGIREQKMSAINNLFNNFERYAGTYGLLDLDKYNLFNDNDKKLYLESYIDGYFTAGSLHLMGNLIRDYLPIGYSLSWFNVFNKKFTLNLSDEDEQIIYQDGFNYYKSIFELARNNLKSHFDDLLNNAYIGDYYINIPTGRMYRFMILPDKGTINVKFVGAIMREAPEVSLELIDAMKEQEDGTFIQNIISLESNIKQGMVENANFKEKYTFKIPKHPDFSIGNVNESDSTETSEVTLTKDSSGYKFDFSLPVPAKIYNNINNNIKPGDYYFDNGNLYQYNSSSDSTLIANLIGHANAPSIIGEIKIIEDETLTDNPIYSSNTITFNPNNTTLSITQLLLNLISNQAFTLLSPYDNNLYIINIYKLSISLEKPIQSYYGVYSKNYRDFNVISCFGEFDENNNISQIYNLEKYEGEWLVSLTAEDRNIYFLIEPYDISTIKCLYLTSSNEIKEIPFIFIRDNDGKVVGINYSNSNINFTPGSTIILTYTIKNYIEAINEQKYFIHGQYYKYNENLDNPFEVINYNYNIEPSWILMELIPSEVIIETEYIENENLNNNQVYSVSYINNVLTEIESQQSQLKWKTLNEFIGG